jgi:hypothetical protein
MSRSRTILFYHISFQLSADLTVETDITFDIHISINQFPFSYTCNVALFFLLKRW